MFPCREILFHTESQAGKVGIVLLNSPPLMSFCNVVWESHGIFLVQKIDNHEDYRMFFHFVTCFGSCL